MKNILVTGGTGYIGTHTCLKLLESGYKLVIIDSNINSSSKSLEKIRIILSLSEVDFKKILVFKKGDIRNRDFLEDIFFEAKNKGDPIEGVIHFAGLKAVGESVQKPILYWDNNVSGSIKLFDVMSQFNCKIIIFSSSATIYKPSALLPFKENSEISPTNPYGNTKASIENILKNIFESSNKEWRVANLRYFNPIGAHESGLIGEDPTNIPNNLFPYLCRVASGRYEHLKIFGNDWPTKDGTGIRDYIHIMDLADAHVSALDFLFKNTPQIIDLNIGTGIGTSVLELVDKFQKLNGCRIPCSFCDRRPGDIPILIANNEKALSILNWKPKKTISDMCIDGWRWQIQNPNGYQ
tara:strand:- start:162 stop:1217 length:1056 start_codon:yes stop_codon:yes gene_type:complete